MGVVWLAAIELTLETPAYFARMASRLARRSARVNSSGFGEGGSSISGSGSGAGAGAADRWVAEVVDEEAAGAV